MKMLEQFISKNKENMIIIVFALFSVALGHNWGNK